MIKKSSLYKRGGFFNFRFKILDLRFIIIPVILIAGFFVPYFSFAWDSHFTHRALTYEVGEFFNYFNDNKLSQEEIDWLMQGAQEEDTPPRWINHFYNPITAEGWKGEHLGENSPWLVKFMSGFVLSSRTPLSAKNWAKNRSAQSDYGLYKGDQTWQKAIDAYLEGDKESAFIALGHVLHLLEDMAVPDHTRGDTHAGIVGDKGSPLENWAKEYNRNKVGKLQTAEELYKSGQKPKEFPILENYIDWNAKYSSENFFSEDTINDSKSNITFKVDKNKQAIAYYNNLPVFTFKDGEKTINSEEILNNYWQRLSKQAVVSGAGVINLFFQEVERRAKLPQKITKKQNAVTNIMWSPFGELVKFYNATTKFAQGLFPQSTTAADEDAESNKIAPLPTPVVSALGGTTGQASPRVQGEEEGTEIVQMNLTAPPPPPPPPKQPETEKPVFDPILLYYVSRVIDGDTITLSNGKDIRLIGIDTPEYGEKCYGEAKAKLESLILGKTVRLEKDKSETDRYGRYLRYIYLDNMMINAIMLQSGYADVLIISPDRKYVDAFKDYREEAKFFERGCLYSQEDKKAQEQENTKATIQAVSYLGWSSAGGSSKPQPPEPEEEAATSAFDSPPLEKGDTGGFNDETPTSTPETLPEDDTAPTSTPSDTTPPDDTDTEFSTSTSDGTATSTPEIIEILPNIIINEIQISGGPGDTNNEFIELYNNSSSTVDISGWALKKKTKNGKEYTNLVSSFADGAAVGPDSYFLITHQTDYTGAPPADYAYSGKTFYIAKDSSVILQNASSTIIDKVGFGSAQDFETAPAENPPASQSINRTDFIDTDNNFNDFVIFNSTPRNSSSTPSDTTPPDDTDTEFPPEPQEPPEPWLNCATSTYGTHQKDLNTLYRAPAANFPEKAIKKGDIITLTADKNPYYVDDTTVIPAGAKLIIEEGVIMKFGRWRNGFSSPIMPITLLINGSLEVNGTASNPVIFTTFRDDAYGPSLEHTDSTPAPGDWGSIQISSKDGETIKIQHAKIYYAGGRADAANFHSGAIFINLSDADIEISDIEVAHSWSGIYSRPFPGAQPNILNSNFAYNQIWGVSTIKDSAIRLVGNTFRCNGLLRLSGQTSDMGGISIEGNPQNVVIENNNFFGNQNTGLNYYTDGGDELEAKNNYWGAPSGPYHSTQNPSGRGDWVLRNVDFTPWTEVE